MKPYKIISVFAAAALTLMQCGCVDISDRQLSPDEASESVAVEENEGVGGELLISLDKEPEETTPAVRPAVITETSFSDAQKEFIDSCLFMGDSICSGFSLYGFSESCCAKGGVAARNINEFTFELNGEQVAPHTAAANSGKKNLVFLMGTNDVNMEDSKKFAEYYDAFLENIETICPDAVLYIMSITPVTEDSGFCYNYVIDDFNKALYEITENSASGKRRFIDSSKGIRAESGGLSEEFAADDGIHLDKSAYYYMLYSLCEEAGVI